jgi:pyruvate/2-oxoglutarate dehydrogenase complex dihydrolipoamide acyltransferase (E2) component
VLQEIKVQDGETVAVGTELGTIGDGAVSEEPAPSAGMPTDTALPTGPPSGFGVPTEAPSPPQTVPSSIAPSGDGDAGGGREVGTPNRYSPAVRRLADEYNVDLSQVKGTGQGGRVSKEDVMAYIGRREVPEPVAPPQPAVLEPAPVATAPAAPPAAPAAPAPTQAATAGEVVRLSPMRRMIAEHMVRSVHEAPHATTTFEVDMSRVVKWREAMREAFRYREGIDLTYLPVVVRATVEGLRENPILNAAWTAEGIAIKREINVGIAVALEDGLIVPVIRNADRKDLATIARDANDLATRARAGKLAVPDVQGGTFTVNNPGVFGTLVSVPIINYPQAAILSMEGLAKRPVVIDDAIAIRPMMNICLSFDHRIMDGLQAARFLQRVKRFLEEFDGNAEWRGG